MRKVFLLFCLILLTGSVINAQTVNVTFQVDMRVKIATGYFNPATDTVTCPGAFNNWLNVPPANTEKVMSDSDNDSIYTITIAMAPNTTYGYKFNVGTGWNGKDENKGDRSLVLGAADTTLPACFFNNYTPYTGDTASVTFNVDMHLPAQSAFNPSTGHVFVAGPFTNWGSGAIEMEDLDGDTVYTVTVDSLISGNLMIYKFIYSASTAANGTWESPTEGDDYFLPDRNRIEGIVDGDNVISRFWNNSNPNVQLADGNILFVCDMSVATELGVFNPNVDSVQIRGEFNGWNDSDPPRSKMNQSTSNPDVWFLNVSFDNQVLNDTMIYKYFINNPGTETYSNTGWEVAISPTTAGNRGRPVVFLGQPDQEQEYQYFEGINPDWVVPSGTTVQATFSVDMTPAADFDPATDTVVWIPRQPFYYAVHNLPWPGDYPRVLVLTDANTDMIYEGTLTINGPDFNGFLYNYGYVDVSAGGGLQQESGSQAECRVRYIAQSGPRAFVSPYSFPQDVWTDGEKPEEEGPTVGITDKGLIPIVYKLSQNYPNPFNPSTKITFSIPEEGLVSLKVFNILGQEVAALLNQDMKRGVYEVDFNAANLSSGIYFYTIKANSFTATKKMMLIK